MNAWRWYEDNAALVTLTLARVARGDPELYDVLWEDVIVRVPVIVGHWRPDHPSGASLTTYVVAQVRRYAYKARRKYFDRRLGPVVEDVACDDGNREDRDEVQYILEGLSPDDREMLVTHYMHGVTFEEMGWGLNVSKRTAFTRVHAALRRAKERARDAR